MHQQGKDQELDLRVGTDQSSWDRERGQVDLVGRICSVKRLCKPCSYTDSHSLFFGLTATSGTLFQTKIQGSLVLVLVRILEVTSPILQSCSISPTRCSNMIAQKRNGNSIRN